MNLSWELLADEKGLAPVLRLEDVVAMPTQDRSEDGTHLLFVLYQEDGLRAPHRASRNGRGHGHRNVSVGPRQVDLEGRAHARLAVDPDVSAALLNDAVDRRQTESGTFALVLG